VASSARAGRNDPAEKALSDWRDPSGPGFRAFRERL